MYENIVMVKTRTGKDEEFKYDGFLHIVDAKKGLRVPRPLAELAMKQNALRWDSALGSVVESKLYIEDDLGTALETPNKPITVKEVEAIKNTDGLGNDSILVNGVVVKKTTIDFNNPHAKEDYSKNNNGA